MSREAFGDPPESQEAPDLCPVCGNDWHAGAQCGNGCGLQVGHLLIISVLRWLLALVP